MTKWCGSVPQTQPPLSTDSCPPSEAPMLHEAGWRNRYLVNHWMPVWSARGCCPDGWWGAWRQCVTPSVNGPLGKASRLFWIKCFIILTIFPPDKYLSRFQVINSRFEVAHWTNNFRRYPIYKVFFNKQL